MIQGISGCCYQILIMGCVVVGFLCVLCLLGKRGDGGWFCGGGGGGDYVGI